MEHHHHLLFKLSLGIFLEEKQYVQERRFETVPPIYRVLGPGIYVWSLMVGSFPRTVFSLQQSMMISSFGTSQRKGVQSDLLENQNPFFGMQRYTIVFDHS